MRHAWILTLLALAGPAAVAPAGNAEIAPLLDAAHEGAWHERWRAVRDIAGVTGEAVFQVRGALLRDPRHGVREAIAWACRLQKDLGTATVLGLALSKDKHPAVRRAAAQALVHFKDRRAVAALVEALGRETDARARLHIVATLRAMTPAPCLLDSERWAHWWQEHAHDPRFAPADEAAQVKEYEGVRLETRTVARIPGKGQKKKPPHLLVLPPFGWNTYVFGPYLLPLREVAAMTWVTLPSVQRLTGRSGYGDDLPVYPVDRLVRALEKFRQARRVDRFLLVAPGASGWFAMRYAIRYPKHCDGLILIDTALDKPAYADVLQRAAARGTKEERWVAKTLMGQNSVKLVESTLNRMHGITVSRSFWDRGDLEAAWLFARAREPQGFATVPDIRWSRHRKIDVPALFLYSGVSAFSGHRHADRIRRHFPQSLVAPIKEVSGAPYIERNEDFHRIVRAWLKRFDLID